VTAAGHDRGTRRRLVAAVVGCAAGAGLALLAATRTWSTGVTARPAPLPPERVAHTGAHLIGWLPALALVGLAGAGALVATRGPARRAVGVLLVLAGLGTVVAGARGLSLAVGGARAWPVLVAAGGLAVAWSGIGALRHGTSWPAMGARYERGGDAAAPAGRATRDRGDAGLWDDIDRGVDPTADEPSHRRAG
jgi:hypothetical protein